MAKDFARGEHMMRRATPIKVDRENDTPTKQGGPNTPSWQNRSYGWKALESDTMPPIPEHFRTGSWMNRFGAGQDTQTEQAGPKSKNLEAANVSGTEPSNITPKQSMLVANAATMGMDEFVMKQIAKRAPGLAAKAAGLSLADGPFPLGEIISIGLTAAAAYEIHQEWKKYQALHMSNTSGEADGEKKKKKKKQTKQTGKEGATDIPSWAKGQKPREGESGKDFARRLLDKKNNSRDYDTGPGSEYNKLKKYGDRHRN